MKTEKSCFGGDFFPVHISLADEPLGISAGSFPKARESANSPQQAPLRGKD